MWIITGMAELYRGEIQKLFSFGGNTKFAQFWRGNTKLAWFIRGQFKIGDLKKIVFFVHILF